MVTERGFDSSNVIASEAKQSRAMQKVRWIASLAMTIFRISDASHRVITIPGWRFAYSGRISVFNKG